MDSWPKPIYTLTPSYTEQLALLVLVLAINYTKLRSIKKLRNVVANLTSFVHQGLCCGDYKENIQNQNIFAQYSIYTIYLVNISVEIQIQ